LQQEYYIPSALYVFTKYSFIKNSYYWEAQIEILILP